MMKLVSAGDSFCACYYNTRAIFAPDSKTMVARVNRAHIVLGPGVARLPRRDRATHTSAAEPAPPPSSSGYLVTRTGGVSYLVIYHQGVRDTPYTLVRCDQETWTRRPSLSSILAKNPWPFIILGVFCVLRVVISWHDPEYCCDVSFDDYCCGLSVLSQF